jgi:hypothetical protein
LPRLGGVIVLAPSSADVSLAVRLAAIPVIMSAAELLLRREALGTGGFLDFEILGLLKGSIGSHDTTLARLFRLSMRRGPYVAVLVAQILSAAALVVVPRSVLLVAVTTGLYVLMTKRNHLSNDGSDDMVVVVLVASALAMLGSSAFVREAWAVFLTGQLLLAYFVSGISKAQSDIWWRGDATTAVLRTRIFGHRRYARLLSRHPTGAVLLTRLTFIFEVLVPAALFAPRPIFLWALAVALVFHLGCALAMGLNTFVWAFAACYPAALWSWRWLAETTSPLSRSVLALLWVSFAATLLVWLWNRHREALGAARTGPLPSPLTATLTRERLGVRSLLQRRDSAR